MKKLQFCLLLPALWMATIMQAQPSKQSLAINQAQQPVIQKAQNHLAKFFVYDFTTKSPIDHATITDQSGNELGMTNTRGNLEVVLPLNTSEYYTIQAEGFGPLRVRLDQSAKKSAKYEIYLPSLEMGYTQKSMNTYENTIPEKEMVKVYVKQDPSTYQKKNQQGGEITFSVQVAASSHPIPEKSAMDQWQSLGHVYVHQEDNMYKLRIGPFSTQTEAKEVLMAVKSKGRKDAFIVVQQNGRENMPADIKRTAPVENTSPVVMEPSMDEPAPTAGEYKVRVASYLQPGAFNPDGIDQLGTLESYRKGEWTIMMIGGFKNLEEARRAQQVVVSKGFADAGVVIDNGGIIESVEEK